MQEYNDYNLNFRQGLNEARYEDDIESISIPEVDNSNYASIGYHDGIEYGKYCVMAGMKYDVKEEHIIAVIDKGFARAQENINSNSIGKTK